MTRDRTLAPTLAEEAARVTASLTETHYTHDLRVDAARGVYDVDCSGYVSLLLESVAPRHYRAITAGLGSARPLARDYHRFAAALSEGTPASGWQGVGRLADGGAGDILAWQRPDEAGDTGHVVVLADTPVEIGAGVFAVPVYDASTVQHYDDSRGAPPKPAADGVGTGTLHITVDQEGRPIRFKFGKGDASHAAPIALARLMPFSAG